MRKSHLMVWLPVIIILGFGILLQHYLFIHWDVAWLVFESKLLLAGGHYGKDFFDPNPPLILYLYIPIDLLSQHNLLTIIEATRLYTFSVGMLCLTLCYYYLNRIVEPNNLLKKSMLLAAIALGFFIIPSYEFAQREHFILMLTTPYILSVIAMAQANHIENFTLRVFIGFLAGIGFAIKPYYFLVPCLTEIYLFSQYKSFRMIFRIENITLFTTIVLYFVSIYCFTHQYLTLILPFVKKYYIGYANYPLSIILSSYVVITTLFSLIAGLVVGSFYQFNSFLRIIIFVNFIYLFLFLIPGQLWYYHAIPMLAFDTILLAWLTIYLLTEETLSLSPIKMYISIAITALAFSSGILTFIGESEDNLIVQKGPYFLPVQVIHFVEQHPKIKSLYTFSVYPSLGAGVSLYAGIKNCSRFTGFWMLPQINKKLQTKDPSPGILHAASFVRNAVVEDFQRCHPDLVIVETTKHMSNFFNLPFNYLDFFLQDAQFKKIWKNYCYITRFNHLLELYVRC